MEKANFPHLRSLPREFPLPAKFSLRFFSSFKNLEDFPPIFVLVYSYIPFSICLGYGSPFFSCQFIPSRHILYIILPIPSRLVFVRTSSKRRFTSLPSLLCQLQSISQSWRKPMARWSIRKVRSSMEALLGSIEHAMSLCESIQSTNWKQKLLKLRCLSSPLMETSQRRVRKGKSMEVCRIPLSRVPGY